MLRILSAIVKLSHYIMWRVGEVIYTKLSHYKKGFLIHVLTEDLSEQRIFFLIRNCLHLADGRNPDDIFCFIFF